MRKLFGTDGIRGRAREFPLDRQSMTALGEALAHRLSEAGGRPPRVLLGMDTRESGPEIAGALAAGIRARGGEAVLIGVIPTPGVAVLCRRTSADAGISISASHNPWEDNGVKVFGSDGMKLSDELEKQTEEEMMLLRDESGSGEIDSLDDSPDLLHQYEEFLLEGLRPGALDGLHVVLDTGNGAAWQLAPDVFARLGADVETIHNSPDGRNINEGCGALHPEPLAERVRASGAAFGVAFDGDADRAIFVDDQGKIRDGDEIILLWARELRRKGTLPQGLVVTTVMSNLGFERQLAHEGLRLLRANVGDKYVLEMMRENGAMLGGEQSGHIIDLSRHTTGDGIYTAVSVAQVLRGAGKPMSQLHTFDPMPQVLVNQKVAAKPPLDTLERYNEVLDQEQQRLGSSGRILVRYSGTENLVRVMVEGESDEEIRRTADTLRQVLQEEIEASSAAEQDRS